MKKILSITGIMVMAAIVSTSAFAGNVGSGDSTNTATTMSATLPTDQAELNAVHSGRNRGGHQGGHRTVHQGGHR